MNYEFYKSLFNELLDDFKSELISHDEFTKQLDEFGQSAVEAIGEDTWRYWLNIRSDYVALEKFNCNENQLMLF
ncbi:hypothetical protein DOK76_12470 [Vagococcus sp. DIV0080]|uniref:Uncharacterized protein n=1 Tax=Candidatus Vagococcus giribetii TaxID=2230876 RepID=A0ABS3HXL8_9ENTE|nr:hypothetical protein [Vagococcus sp. DIV0080]MBO0477888.1 hypothetical protein [Vagococcus sp. DIV0080]